MKEMQKTIPIFLSDFSSEEVQVVADAMLYYQTSMGPRFVLSGIPTIQVGHAVYEDILVEQRLCAVATDLCSFQNALSHLAANIDIESNYDALLHALSFTPDWRNRLEQSVDQFRNW